MFTTDAMPPKNPPSLPRKLFNVRDRGNKTGGHLNHSALCLKAVMVTQYMGNRKKMRMIIANRSFNAFFRRC